MIVLSVDPATTSGWALWRDGRLLRFGSLDIVPKCKGASFPFIGSSGVMVQKWWEVDLRPCLASEGAEADDACLVIEHHGPKAFKGHAAHMRLTEHRRTWEVVAELHGWRVVQVNVNTWQAAVLGKGRVGHTKEIARQVALSVGLAPSLATSQVLTEDAADAICIGIYHHRREQIEGAAT